LYRVPGGGLNEWNRTVEGDKRRSCRVRQSNRKRRRKSGRKKEGKKGRGREEITMSLEDPPNLS